MIRRHCVHPLLLAVSCCALSAAILHAAPVASNVSPSGTNVSFILNEPADSFSIIGRKTAPTGSTISASTSHQQHHRRVG